MVWEGANRDLRELARHVQAPGLGWIIPLERHGNVSGRLCPALSPEASQGMLSGEYPTSKIDLRAS